MEGLLFLFACIGIGLVAFWVMQNDQAGPGEPTKGLFAMRSEPSIRDAKAGPHARRIRSRSTRSEQS